MTQTATPVFLYLKARADELDCAGWIIDEAVAAEDCRWVTRIERLDLGALASRYPGGSVVLADSYDHAEKMLVEVLCSRPREITESQFTAAFECLPPVVVPGIAAGVDRAFRLSEEYAFGVGTFYVQAGDRYYTMRSGLSSTKQALFDKIGRLSPPHASVVQ